VAGEEEFQDIYSFEVEVADFVCQKIVPEEEVQDVYSLEMERRTSSTRNGGGGGPGTRTPGEGGLGPARILINGAGSAPPRHPRGGGGCTARILVN
jgi:hypothetical protein